MHWLKLPDLRNITLLEGLMKWIVFSGILFFLLILVANVPNILHCIIILSFITNVFILKKQSKNMIKLPKNHKKLSFEFSRQIFYVICQFSKYLNFHAKIVYLTNFQIIWIFAPKMPKMRFWWWFTVFENYSKCLILQNRELILFLDENIWIFAPKLPTMHLDFLCYFWRENSNIFF